MLFSQRNQIEEKHIRRKNDNNQTVRKRATTNIYLHRHHDSLSDEHWYQQHLLHVVRISLHHIFIFCPFQCFFDLCYVISGAAFCTTTKVYYFLFCFVKMPNSIFGRIGVRVCGDGDGGGGGWFHSQVMSKWFFIGKVLL